MEINLGGGPVEGLYDILPPEEVPITVKTSEAVSIAQGKDEGEKYYMEHKDDKPSPQDSPFVRDVIDPALEIGQYTPVLGTILDGFEFIENPSWLNALAFGTGAALDLASFGVGNALLKGAGKAAVRYAPRAAVQARRQVRNITRAVKRVTPKVNSPFLRKYGKGIVKNGFNLGQDILFNTLQKKGESQERKRRKRKKNKRDEKAADNC